MAKVKPTDLPLPSLGQELLAELASAPSRLEQLYAALTSTNEAILRASSATELYQRVCDAAVGSGLLAVAAVLLPGTTEPHTLETVASSGRSTTRITISTDPARPEGRGLAGTAFNTGEPCVSHDFLRDARMAPWLETAQRAGIRAGAAVPLLVNGRSTAVLLFHSRVHDTFDARTVGLLERMAENIGFALRGFEQLAERARMAEELWRFRTAMDLSGDAIYLTDPETMRFIDANETALQRVGYSRAELLTIGPIELTSEPREEITALFRKTIECAPAAIITRQLGKGSGGRTWMSEISRRAVSLGGRWMIVTISRNVEDRHRQETLQALQHRVTRRLAQPGVPAAALDAVLMEIGTTLGLERGLCITADADTGVPRQLARWHREGMESLPETDNVDALSLALGAPAGCIGQAESAGLLEWGVPTGVDGRTLGALVLHGSSPLLPGYEQTLVGIGEQVGQFISRKQAEDVLARSEERFRALTELSSDWYWESDSEQRFVSFGGRDLKNVGAGDWRLPFFGRAIWNVPNAVADSADFDSHRSQIDRRENFRDFQFAVRDAQDGLRWTSASGEPVFDAGGVFVGYRGVARDVTTQRRAEASIRHLATHDVLTGLPNRALFAEVLADAIRDARLNGTRLALLFVDLDHFKIINDTLGHEAGDLMLQQMARALSEGLRTSDLVARLGGDEFVVLLRRPESNLEATMVARKLLAATTQPMQLGGQECRVSASIGICMFPDDAGDEQSLMKGADIAMYQAKREGRNAFRFYSADGPHSMQRLRMESNLRSALERNELCLHYQPKVDLASGRISGVEALLRWTSVELGPVPPANFIPLAEEIGVIHAIGRWVLRHACNQHMAWRRAGLPPIPVAVNLSPRQFDDNDLVADIERALSEVGMPGEMLELEITEGMVVGNPARALKTLKAIKHMGVRLSIDDFGTGYSSLAQLKHFPIDSLKIDRSFICGIPSDPQDMAITEAIVVMARTLRMTVVAEGVETLEQREFLRDRGCGQMQGYLFSKPLPADELAALVQRHGEAPPLSTPPIKSY